MSILLTMNKHHLLLLFVFVHAENSLNKLKLYNNWLAQVGNSILENVMWNSSKLINFAHLWNLANQSILNKAHVIETTKACTVAFMKARSSFVVQCK